MLTSFPPFEEELRPSIHHPGSRDFIAKRPQQIRDKNLRPVAFFTEKFLKPQSNNLIQDDHWHFPAQRIDALSSKGVLSPEVTGWAHEIRIIRNDAVHEVEQIGAEDVSAIAEFTEAFLLVVYTMREKIRHGSPKETWMAGDKPANRRRSSNGYARP